MTFLKKVLLGLSSPFLFPLFVWLDPVLSMKFWYKASELAVQPSHLLFVNRDQVIKSQDGTFEYKGEKYQIDYETQTGVKIEYVLKGKTGKEILGQYAEGVTNDAAEELQQTYSRNEFQIPTPGLLDIFRDFLTNCEKIKGIPQNLLMLIGGYVHLALCLF